jgi:hypothetical protein
MTFQLSRDYSLTTFTQLLQAEAPPAICVDALEDADVSDKDAVLMYARDSAACEGLTEQATFHGYKNGQPVWKNPAQACHCKKDGGLVLAPENCPTCHGNGVIHPPLKPLLPVLFPQAVFAEFCLRRWGEEVGMHVGNVTAIPRIVGEHVQDLLRAAVQDWNNYGLERLRPIIARAVKRHALTVVPVDTLPGELTEETKGILTASWFVPNEPLRPGQEVASDEIHAGRGRRRARSGRCSLLAGKKPDKIGKYERKA